MLARWRISSSNLTVDMGSMELTTPDQTISNFEVKGPEGTQNLPEAKPKAEKPATKTEASNE